MKAEQVEQNIFRLLMEQERAVGEFYKVIAEKHPYDAPFWLTLAEEEEGHARLLEKLEEQIHSGKARIVLGTIMKTSLPVSIGKVNEMVLWAKENDMTRKQCIAEALSIEHQLLEEKFYEIIDNEAVWLKEFKLAMRKSIDIHLGRLKDAYKQVQAEDEEILAEQIRKKAEVNSVEPQEVPAEPPLIEEPVEPAPKAPPPPATPVEPVAKDPAPVAPPVAVETEKASSPEPQEVPAEPPAIAEPDEPAPKAPPPPATPVEPVAEDDPAPVVPEEPIAKPTPAPEPVVPPVAEEAEKASTPEPQVVPASPPEPVLPPSVPVAPPAPDVPTPTVAPAESAPQHHDLQAPVPADPVSDVEKDVIKGLEGFTMLPVDADAHAQISASEACDLVALYTSVKTTINDAREIERSSQARLEALQPFLTQLEAALKHRNIDYL